MTKFKSCAFALLATTAIIAATGPSLAATSHNRTLHSVAAKAPTARRPVATAPDEMAVAQRQCENVEQYYAAARKEHPGIVPGDGSSWAQWAADQDRAIASAPTCH